MSGEVKTLSLDDDVRRKRKNYLKPRENYVKTNNATKQNNATKTHYANMRSFRDGKILYLLSCTYVGEYFP